MSYDVAMRRAMVALALCASCSTVGMNEEQRRWPDHRKIEEKRITDLEAAIVQLTSRITALEAKLREARPPTPEQ